MCKWWMLYSFRNRLLFSDVISNVLNSFCFSESDVIKDVFVFGVMSVKKYDIIIMVVIVGLIM